MSVTIGGFTPGFRFRLYNQSASPKVLSATSSGVTSGQVLDALQITNGFTGVITGTQYSVQAIPEQFVVFGTNPTITFSTNNSGVATIDQFGNTTYVTTGNFNVIGSYDTNGYYKGQSVNLSVTNLSGGGNVNIVKNYIPDPVDVAKHVLIVYNSGSVNSTNLKTYYTGNRPQFNLANVLAINCDSGQYTSYSGFTNNIRTPIVNYLTGNSGSKPIRYIVMMMEIPTNVSDTNISSISYQITDSLHQLGLRQGSNYNTQANSHFSLGQYQNHAALVSHINFSGYADCTGYINKISQGRTGIYLSGNGTNTGYYVEDTNNIYSASFPTFCSGRYIAALNLESGVKNITYQSASGSYITTGKNLAGFVSWMTNGLREQAAPTDGNIRWGGTGNWYIMTTIESFNGMAQPLAYQSTYLLWFQSNAFGGTNYSNIPVGAVGHTWEPSLGGLANSGFFALWQRGWPFIECAWQSRSTNYFAAFGDPLVCK